MHSFHSMMQKTVSVTKKYFKKGGEFPLVKSTNLNSISLTAIPAAWPLTDDFRNDWNNLSSHLEAVSPFCMLEWIETGIQIYGGNDRILAYRFCDKEGTLHAMGLFRETREKGKSLPYTVVRTIEYNSQRIAPILASSAVIMAEALKALRNNSAIRPDYFDFYKLEPAVLIDDGNSVSDHLSALKVPYTIQVFNEQPQFILKDSWVEYLAERTQGHRKKIRRYTRKLQEEYTDYSFIRLRTPEDYASYGIEKMLDEVIALFKRSWQAEKMLEEDSSTMDRLITFYRSIAEKFIPLGLLDVCLLKADGSLLASELNLCKSGIVYMLFGSFNREYAAWSPGNAILSEIIQDSYASGYSVIEFGGEYLDYKKLWTKNSVQSYHIRIYGKTLRAVAKRCIKRLLRK